ncbi:hypothetical protein DS2_06926 [Catenovulum agarivorans DS-2]|uniref:Secreted protein n=1 Tax=Catenovulum agarivorans DS-2 TaxID=1328313 RepID=W7QCZ4_9ALTE|nr:hypothetical protein [Catenovulum agarivorans]EWH10764.1 hypothetical protein DS2_06926 [Catenovulum agarivorans DS-2]
MLKTIGIIALTTLATFLSQAVEIVDRNTDSTSGKQMHICGVGVMSGLNVNKNRLLCNVVVREMPSLDDYSNSRLGMHVCSLGTEMLGIHVNDNEFLCSQLGN